MKVLLFSNDLMPFGNLPTSGGGLRCWQLMKGLEAHGVEVLASMPGFTYLAEKHYAEIPEPQRELLWRWETQDEILKRTKPDAVLFASNWDHFNLTKSFNVPLIVDLHGSRLIETTMWNNPVSTDKKVKVLGLADCLLTAGRRQRSYFYGWLVQAGRVPADEHFIRYIPISLGPDQPQKLDPSTYDDRAPYFVSGGGWFPWQNQSKAIFAICREVAARQRGSIQIFGTPHETAHVSAEEKVIREVYGRVRELAESSDRIKVAGYIGRDDLIEIYRRSSVAVELMQYNLERELAFTTRTIEYLWCGLPVLYNNYAEISDHISEYDAGWTIDPTSDTEIARVIDEIVSNPELVKVKGENAQRLVRDRFSWDKTITPLLDFLHAPTIAARVEPALGTTSMRPSFLSPRGSTVDIPVYANGAALQQQLTTPAENLAAVEIPLLIGSSDARERIAKIEVEVRVKGKRRLVREQFRPDDLPSSGRLVVKFPRLRRPAGGSELSVTLKVIGKSPAVSNGGSAEIFVRGLCSPTFPFQSGGLSSISNRNDASSEVVSGRGLLGDPVEVGALALHFIPGGGGVYRAKLLVGRAQEMIRRGEWRRLIRAVINRSPGAVRRLRRLAFRNA